MKTTFKDETNSTVHAHREGDTVHLTRPKTGSTLTSLPYHHFDTSEHAKPAAKKPAGEYDRKVTDHLKKKYNEEAEQMDELNKDTVYSYAAKAEKDVDRKHKDLTAQIKSNNPLSANKTADKIVKRYRGMDRAENRLNKEETEQILEAPKSVVKLVQKLQTTKRHMVAKSRAKKLVTASKSASAAGDKMAADTAMSKSKRYSNIAKGMEEQMDEKVTSRDIKMAVGVAKDKRYAGGNMSGAVKTMEKMKPGLSKHPRVQQVLKSTQEGIDFLKIWNGIKPVHEEVKTTHEDPLVLTKDTEGHIHTHANLSVANAIHGTDVKHQAIHTGKPVQAGKFTFELSKHHEGALKEDAPFDAAAHKKEHDRLMGKHMAAHAETSKLINAKAPQEQINKAQERNNAVKQEIRNHKDKVPKGPAPKKDGGPGDYYASKKPGEYTGD